MTIDAGLAMPVSEEVARAFAGVEKRYGPPVFCTSGACAQARQLWGDDRISETDYLRGMCYAHGLERVPTEELSRVRIELLRSGDEQPEMMVLPVGWVTIETASAELARRGVLYIGSDEEDEAMTAQADDRFNEDGIEDEPTEAERASANGAWEEKKVCPECGRVFDLRDENDASEWSYGHDCER